MRRILSCFLVLLITACGGSDDSASAPVITSEIHGTVSKGPVAGAVIRLYRMDANGHASGAPLTEPVISDADGNWSVTLRNDLRRPLLAVAEGGSYQDEATGATISIGDATLEGLLLDGADTLAITPLSQTLVNLGRTHLATSNDTLTQAVEQARITLRSILHTAFNPLTNRPVSPHTTNGGSFDRRAHALLLAGLSQLARDIAPGEPPFSTVNALMRDLEDGVIDGRLHGEGIPLGGATLPELSLADWVNALESIKAALGSHYDDVGILIDGQQLTLRLVHSIGGTINGLDGSGLAIENNGVDSLTPVTDGPYLFNDWLANGSPYDVTIVSQPQQPDQTCEISNASGLVFDTDITHVHINCQTNRYSIGGNVSGLGGGDLILRNNGVDDLLVNENGEFVFDTPIADLSNFEVTVHQHPAASAQHCEISHGSGEINGGPVSDVSISCSNRYAIGGSLSNLLGAGLVLRNNDGDDLTVMASNDHFFFDTLLAEGDNYNVTLHSAPTLPSQTCQISQGSGTVGTADIDDITLSCQTDSFAIGGSVQGMQGGGLILQNNGTDDLLLDENGDFTFATAITDLESYHVSILEHPADQQCFAEHAQGTVQSGPVDDVLINCYPLHTIGGTITGLTGSGLVLRNNDDNLLVAAFAEEFEFAALVALHQPYTVTVVDQPHGQHCVVENASGVVDADISNILVACQDGPPNYPLGGEVLGLVDGELVLSLDDGSLDDGQQTSITLDGPFQFADALPEGTPYSVTISAQPQGHRQQCVIAGDEGSIDEQSHNAIEIHCQLTWHLGISSWQLDALPDSAFTGWRHNRAEQARSDMHQAALFIDNPCHLIGDVETDGTENALVTAFGWCQTEGPEEAPASDPINTQYETHRISLNFTDQTDDDVTDHAWSLVMQAVGSDVADNLPRTVSGAAASHSTGPDFQGQSHTFAVMTQRSLDIPATALGGNWGLIRLASGADEDLQQLQHSSEAIALTISEANLHQDSRKAWAVLQSLNDDALTLQHSDETDPVLWGTHLLEPDGSLTITRDHQLPTEHGFTNPETNLFLVQAATPDLEAFEEDGILFGHSRLSTAVAVRRHVSPSLNGRNYRLHNAAPMAQSNHVGLSSWLPDTQIEFITGGSGILDLIRDQPSVAIGGGPLSSTLLNSTHFLDYNVADDGLISVTVSNMAEGETLRMQGYASQDRRTLVLASRHTREADGVVEEASVGLVVGVCNNCD